MNEKDVRIETLKYFNDDELATDVWMKKYAKRGENGVFLESTPDDMHKRLAKEFHRIEQNYNNPLSYDEIYETLKGFKYIVPQGGGMSGIGAGTRQSLSNCFVVDSPQDSISGIMNTARDMANIFRMRGGVGVDISTLRPDGADVNNSARTSTGAWSFADFYSYVTRMIGQNNRRGASMISMDIKHPDAEKFTTMKADLTKVTGANISLKISDEFMEAVKADGDFVHTFPIDLEVHQDVINVLEYDKVSKLSKGQYAKKIKAKNLWDIITKTATDTAEPGILFWDTGIRNLPSHEYPQFETISTNPCAELMLSAGSSCRLISINLKNFVDLGGVFDYDKFKKITEIATKLSDDLVDLEIEKIKHLVDTSNSDERELWTKVLNDGIEGRRTGLGTHGLADMLANMGIIYGSLESQDTIKQIYTIFKNTVYGTSVDLAIERGPFPAYEKQYNDNAFLNRLDKDVQEKMDDHGRRNVALMTISPTGSVSIVSQVSSGIEPVFQNEYIRRRKLMVGEEAENIFTGTDGEKFVEYTIRHHNVKEWVKNNPDTELPEQFIESHDVNWKSRVDVQSELTSCIDHSISSTLNLPRGTTSDTVADIYMYSWEQGLKGVTVYVDGSRDGVLIKKEEESKEELDDKGRPTKINRVSSPARPRELECDIHTLTAKGDRFTVVVGLMDGEAYEVFAMPEISELKNSETGIMKKVSKGHYDLISEDIKIENITSNISNDEEIALTRMVSLALRHGADMGYVVDSLNKADGTIVSFSKAIARTLKKYSNVDTSVNMVCPQCGSENYRLENGCSQCYACGFSKCG